MVGITIPLVLGVTFLAMLYFGIGLQKISLRSLIIALNVLVDDASIAIEMMVRKMAEGFDKFRADTRACDVTAMPMLTDTLITAVGLLPIGQPKLVTGKYTYAIFVVTVITLDLWLPEGTSFAVNDATTKRVEERLLKEECVTTVATWVGEGVPRF